MKSVGGLFATVTSRLALERAMHRAACGKQDRPGVARFLAAALREIEQLHGELRSESYRPRPYRQFSILDPKPRLISCADFRDRVVHQLGWHSSRSDAMTVAVGFNPRITSRPTFLLRRVATAAFSVVATRLANVADRGPWVETHGYHRRSLRDQMRRWRSAAKAEFPMR